MQIIARNRTGCMVGARYGGRFDIVDRGTCCDVDLGKSDVGTTGKFDAWASATMHTNVQRADFILRR